MTMTFSNFTQITIILLTIVILFHLFSLAIHWLQFKKSQHYSKSILKHLADIDLKITSIVEQMDKLTLHTVNIKSDTHHAYQTATHMIKQDCTVDEIVAECGLAHGEIELLRAITAD